MVKYDPVDAWLENLAFSHSRSQGTAKAYQAGLNTFCIFIESTPAQILADYQASTDRAFKQKYAAYLRAYIGKLSKAGLTGNTVNTRVTAVKSFFKYNDLPIGFVPRGTGRVTYHNRDITKQEIVDIIGISRPRDKAFFTMMAQTGLRPTTMCSLKLKHIQPDFSNGSVPCRIEVPQDLAKGKYHRYFTFMGEESLRYLQLYLDTRRNIGPESLLFMSYGVKKPLDPRSISQVFKRSIEDLKAKGKIDFEQKGKGKPRSIRLYNLRKFFRKYAAQAGFENVQFWMGHTVNAGVDAHYRPRDPEFYREIYAEKAMPFLRLEEATPSETEKTIMELRAQLDARDKANMENAQKIRVLEEMMQKILKDQAELKRMLRQKEEQET